MQQIKQTMFPQPNSMGRSSILTHMLHSRSVFVGSVFFSVGKNEAGAMAVIVDTMSLTVSFFGLPVLPVLPPPVRRQPK